LNVNFPVPVAVEVAPRERRTFPPIVPIAVLSLICVVAGGIILASYVPRRPPLGVPIALLVLSVLFLLAALVLLARIREFAWRRFFQVGGWALLAYVISSGMIEFAFVRNHTRGAPLVVVTAMLVVFALDVPLNIAFTVARYQDV
jgi:hypothetical protein